MYGNMSKSGKLIYIEIPETRNPDYAELCRKKAQESEMIFVPIEGSIDLLAGLINGSWKPEDFLMLNPGDRSIGVYDWDEIITGINEEG